MPHLAHSNVMTIIVPGADQAISLELCFQIGFNLLLHWWWFAECPVPPGRIPHCNIRCCGNLQDPSVNNRVYSLNHILSPSGIILCMGPANESRRYNVMSCLIGWVHTQNDPSTLNAAPSSHARFSVNSFITPGAVHEMASRPLAQFDLILAWASWKLLWAT